MFIESVMPSNHLSLLLPSSPAFNLSQHQCLFQWVSSLHQVAKVLQLQLQHQSFQDWLDLLAVSRVFSNTTVQKHHFFGALPSLWSNSHICIWLLEKTIALTVWIFVGKVMSLLFHMLSRFVIAFLLRSKCLLISLLQLPSAVILEPKKIKSVTVSIVSLSICLEVMGLDTMIFVFWMLSFKPKRKKKKRMNYGVIQMSLDFISQRIYVMWDSAWTCWCVTSPFSPNLFHCFRNFPKSWCNPGASEQVHTCFCFLSFAHGFLELRCRGGFPKVALQSVSWVGRGLQYLCWPLASPKQHETQKLSTSSSLALTSPSSENTKPICQVEQSIDITLLM